MAPHRRESLLFAAALAALIAGVFHASLFGGKVLSPGDVVFANASFADSKPPGFEPANRLLMDPVLQFGPWLEFTRAAMRAGHLPLWNPLVGCGAPHLANGQSAVFDPFHLIAYLGTLPEAIAWMAAARLWVAGLGMFTLSWSWGTSRRGRWLSGLSYPFCGFLMVWLMYPVTSVAVWMPWLFLATDRALDGRRFAVSGLALAVGFVMLGGHVQTSAHVLLAAGLYAAWRVLTSSVTVSRVPRVVLDQCSPDRREHWSSTTSGTRRWVLGISVGLSLASIEILPLAAYLSRSPVWSDRAVEKLPILKITRPRILDAATTALPYLYGSQRRGHPNLAKALGVHNLNESAGGFAGLATLIWLAPAAWLMRKTNRRVPFLAGLGVFGAMGAFGVFPVANLLRAIPVLDVADNRRLTLWVAFALTALAGAGIDAVPLLSRSRGWVVWSRSWVALAALLVLAAIVVATNGPAIRRKAIEHYARAAASEPGSDPANFRERAERQARLATEFPPRYYGMAAAHLLLLAAMAEGARRATTQASVNRLQIGLITLVLVDLLAFGYDLNPAIPPADDRPDSEVIAYLRREVPPPLRVLAVGAELPPNILMRYGLADVRNYDSIELSRSLAWFDSLYDAEPDRPGTRTSRRTIRWANVERSIERLQLAGVGAIVGASPPPEGVFRRVDRVGRVWIARLDSRAPQTMREGAGQIRVDLRGDRGQVGWVAETFDPGWKAEVDGRPIATYPHLGVFLAARVPAGSSRLVFRYDPPEVRIAAWLSLLSLGLIGLIAVVERTGEKTRFETRNGLSAQVRIKSDIIARPVLTDFPPTEGRDADGPLHV